MEWRAFLRQRGEAAPLSSGGAAGGLGFHLSSRWPPARTHARVLQATVRVRRMIPRMNKHSLLAAVLAAAALAPAFAAPPGCPPGLAKKHNGCLPPGQVKQVYRDAVVGHHVPPNAVYVVPRGVRVTLPRPPAGYRYAIVNNQVILVSNTNMVVDIVRDLIG